MQITQLKKEGKIKPNASSTELATESTPSESSGNPQIDKLRMQREQLNLGKSAIDQYADKLGAKLGGRKGRAMGMNLPTTASKIISGESDSERKAKLGSLDYDDLELDEDDDEEFYLPEEQRLQDIEIATQSASDAIGMLRRNVDEAEEETEMNEDDMLKAVQKALLKPNFKTTRERYLEEEADDRVKPPPLVVPTTTVSSTSVTPPKTTSGVGGSWSPPAQEQNTYQPKVGAVRLMCL